MSRLAATAPRAAVATMRAALLRRAPAGASARVGRVPTGAPLRWASSAPSSSDHSTHAHADEASGTAETKEEWLRIARELSRANVWPHEEFAPPHVEFPPSLLEFPEHPSDATGTDTPRTLLPFAAKALAAAALVYAGVAALNDASANGSNPLTNFIANNANTGDGSIREMERLYDESTKRADDTKILLTKLPPPMYRIKFTGIFERHSDFLIEPGTQSAVTDGNVEIKYSWKEDDDLFGPPFPKSE
ncbi:hypothetical protein HDU82_005481 [Entophlyctis luteolus]|nr:hypothetical protein HDU82_005481 [Entophlyctis luteolus]